MNTIEHYGTMNHRNKKVQNEKKREKVLKLWKY